MLKAQVIGNLGADAEVKSSNGKEFVSFRVAHSFNFTSNSGEQRRELIWVDVTASNIDKLLPYLKKGCSVFIEGNISLRVYSSKVDRCMKAGISVHADTIQLLGGSVDAVPKSLVNAEDGTVYEVSKRYRIDELAGKIDPGKELELTDNKGNSFVVDCLGEVSVPKQKAE